MYLSKNEKKIKSQEKLIARLLEENECLREQVKEYESMNLYEKMTYADEQLGKLNGLIIDVQEYKKEYLRLNRKLFEEINKIKGVR